MAAAPTYRPPVFWTCCTVESCIVGALGLQLYKIDAEFSMPTCRVRKDLLLRRFEAQTSSEDVMGLFLVSIAQRFDDVTCQLFEKTDLQCFVAHSFLVSFCLASGLLSRFRCHHGSMLCSASYNNTSNNSKA